MNQPVSVDTQARLLSIVERAAPPEERIEQRWFQRAAVQDDARSARLSARWRGVAAGEPSSERDNYIEQFGLRSEASVRPGIDAVVLRNPEQLPRWATRLLDLLAAAERAESVRPQADAITTLMVGAEHLLEDLIAPCTVSIAGDARSGMVSVLEVRLHRLFEPLSDFELSTARTNARLFGGRASIDDVSLDPTYEGWLERFEDYPVAAYLLGVTIESWDNAIIEPCGALDRDYDRLCDEMFAGNRVGALVGFQGDLGDVHDHGRSVALLTFESSDRVLYKPKDLRCAATMLGLIEHLTPPEAPLDLGTRRMLISDSYAWDEFVDTEACESREAVGRFYQRMGMTIRLLQFLEGRDFWLDNLIAHGEQPVFIDLETVLQPRRRTPNLAASEHASRAVLGESVVETCAVVMMTPIEPGVAAVDLGALAKPDEYLSPFRRTTLGQAQTTSRPEDSFFTWTHPEHAPMFEGQPAEPADHLDDIEAGFRMMHSALVDAQPDLLATDGPLAAFRDVPVRFIFRDTWTYLRLARQSTAPTLLVDPVEREIFLQQLMRPVLVETTDASLGIGQGQLVRDEIASLRRLDVPFFVSRPDTDAAFTVSAERVDDQFDGTAWGRLIERVERLPDSDVDHEVDLLRSCFSTAHAVGDDVGITIPPKPAKRTDEEVLKIGMGIVESVVADAIGTPEDLRWVGLHYEPHMDLTAVGVLPADLLTGGAGLAVLFAELYVLTRDESWRELTIGSVRPTVAALERAPGMWQALAADNRPRTVPTMSGAFVGTGAQLFAAWYCSELVGSPELRVAADTLVGELDAGVVAASAGTDVVCGSAGLALALTSPFAPREAQKLAADLLLRIDETTTANDGRASPLYPPSAIARLRGLPCTEHTLLLADARRDPSSTYDGEFSVGSCSHPSASLLVGLDLGRHHGVVREELSDAAAHHLAGLESQTDSWAALDALEVAVASYEVTSDSLFRDHAMRIIDAFLRCRETSGSWFPDRFSSDRHELSLVWGAPALARACFRLATPGNFSTIRLLSAT